MHVRLTEARPSSSRIPGVAGDFGTESLLPGRVFLQFLFPSCCASCGAARRGVGGGGLCRACWRALPLIDGNDACQTCALPSAAPLCHGCLESAPPVSRAAAVARYEGVTRRLVHALKFRGHDILAAPAGALMTAAARTCGLDRDCEAVVPIPSTARRNRDRGYDPGALLAEEVARRLGRPLLSLLSRVREAPPQSTVPAARRRGNVLGAFASSRAARGARLLLVDDVMTTGATAFEAARTLGAAGAVRIDLLVLARTPEAGPLHHTHPEST